MLKKYYATHKENKMSFEGDTKRARDNFYNRPSANLYLLLAGRYSWMNRYIKDSPCHFYKI